MTIDRAAVMKAWEEIRDTLNREYREGVISYRELKIGVNMAAIMREAAIGPEE